MSVRTEAIGAPVAAVTADASLAWRRAALWGLLGAKVVSSWGVQWDIQWHTLIGRDSFWIAPHLMTYAGVVVMVGLSFGVLAATTLSPSWRGGDVVRVLGLTGTRGFHLAAWGIALTVLAAPIDDLWHRLFGLDVTLWSPPHLLGLLGAAINTLGCFRIAREVYPATSRAAFAAVVVTGALLYIGLHFALQPSFRIAYLNGGVFFHFYAMLASLMLPVALVATAHLSALRVPPARAGHGRDARRARVDAGRGGRGRLGGGPDRGGARTGAALRYFVITPQATRAPELPAGSVISSSGSAWMTSASPVTSLSVVPTATASSEPAPFDPTTRFGRSPAWAPSGFL